LGTGEIIPWAVRWYLMFPIGDRDLELILRDRAVTIDRTTIFRPEGRRGGQRRR
jgi:transposase-like protein